MFQSSCSELLVDTAIHDPEEALRRFTTLFNAHGLDSSPPLTLEVLEELKAWHELTYDERESGDYTPVNVVVFDKDGNRVELEYGHNGYIHTGYRFDSGCADYDHRCFPIFKKAIDILGGELIACDGGTTGAYEDWDSDNNRDDEAPF
jgi:hypothetical protein